MSGFDSFIDSLTSIPDVIMDAVNSVMPIWPQLLILIAAVLVPAVFFISKSKKVTAGFSLVMIALTALLIADRMHYAKFGEYAGLFTFDTFSGLMMLLFLAVVFVVVLASPAYAEGTKHHGEYYALLLSATAGMMFVASASDLVSIFIGVELTSISTYALVAMKKNDPRSSEAAVKYMIIGGLSTALTLYGMSLMYGATGSTNIADIAAVFSSGEFSMVYAVAFVTLLAGYGFKISAVPFHMWAPDVYEGAATPVSAFLATGSKKMGLVVFMKIFLLIFVGATVAPVQEIQYFFAILAAITMTVGNIVAISQTNIKRMLAYSSVAQAGYLLIIFAVATEYALAAGIFHMITHVFMKGGAFIVVAALATAAVGEKISDYNGLAKRAPFVAFAMMLFLFSLAGIPPLAGFASKFFLFSSALNLGGDVGGTWIWLVFVAVINSAISLYYYARVVKAMYVDKGPETKVKVPKTHIAALAICVIAVIVLGVYPEYILGLCEAAASTFWASV